MEGMAAQPFSWGDFIFLPSPLLLVSAGCFVFCPDVPLVYRFLAFFPRLDKKLQGRREKEREREKTETVLVSAQSASTTQNKSFAL